MSMILFACVFRVNDGLPLSASTDFIHNKELQECKSHVRALSLRLSQSPDRGTINGNELNIHFSTSEGLSFVTVCSSSYPPAMAFCFLEELRGKFVASYNSISIGLASRPYAFLSFDDIIQEVKWQFNNSSCPSVLIPVVDVQEDLKIRPPRLLKREDIMLVNGVVNGHLQSNSGSGFGYRMEPITALGILSIVLNIMCASLNLIRGVHLADFTFQDDHEGIGNIIAFLVAFVACIYQCYLYLFYNLARKLKTLVALVSIFLCNFYLYGLRSVWQIVFHIGVASASAYLILTRKLTERLPNSEV
ncbi:vesicle-trafficking protein SEC22c [Protopterus annectens]|uniref:vesicle-trafficking protein SEC22c n=1 Tax=Protopterus annectens TaxID=7888 RepID=UPI001CFB2E18|nr:vesicle-trafficking protein SEC22c [Protopterus annectens]